MRLLLLLLLSTTLHAAPKPNILFILTDDQAEWAMGCSGNPDARTPHLDRLAREGIRLTNCFTPTPVCSPSRVSIIAGRYGSELGITDWIHHNNEKQLGLDPAAPVWPRLLAQAGYRTGLIGKWHLGLQDRCHPSVFGYQYFMGFRAGGTTPRDPELEIDGKIQKVPGYVVDLLTDDALKFLRRNSQTPFALSLHFREPHRLYTPLPESERPYSESLNPTIPNPDYPDLDLEKVRQYTREYLGSVAAIDRNVGRILAELDRLRLAENTLVIFTSDHGYNIGHHGIWHKGNASWILTNRNESQNTSDNTDNIPPNRRPNLFDTSLKVPALIRWPAGIPAGSTISRTITHLDWFPTILAAADISPPQDTLLRGQSILPLLTGAGDLDRSDDLYLEYSVHHTMRADMRGYRTPEWKLKRDFLNPGRDELYHLKTDPHETNNLATSDSPESKAAFNTLSQSIRKNMQTLNDPLLKKISSP